MQCGMSNCPHSHLFCVFRELVLLYSNVLASPALESFTEITVVMAVGHTHTHSQPECRHRGRCCHSSLTHLVVLSLLFAFLQLTFFQMGLIQMFGSRRRLMVSVTSASIQEHFCTLLPNQACVCACALVHVCVRVCLCVAGPSSACPSRCPPGLSLLLRGHQTLSSLEQSWCLLGQR